MKKRYLLLVLLLLNLPSTIAVGLSPVSVNVDYEIGTTKEFTFYLLNNLGVDIDANFYTDGQYTDFITFKEPIVRVPPSQTKEVHATITFPQKPLPPGQHHIKIGVIENPINRATQGITPRVGVEMKIKFDIPYPGKYLSLNLEIPNINTGEKLPINLYTKSLGKQTIDYVTGTITLTSGTTTIKELPITLHTINPEEEKTYSITLPPESLPPGDYQAAASIIYDTTYGEASTNFRIGSLYINITNYTQKFQQGKIEEMAITIASRWNKNIDDVYATIDINKEGRTVLSLKTPSISLRPWEESILRAYLDTTSLATGTYDTTITLHYLTSTTIQQTQILIYKEIHINTNYLLIGIILLILLIDILWLIKRKKP